MTVAGSADDGRLEREAFRLRRSYGGPPKPWRRLVSRPEGTDNRVKNGPSVHAAEQRFAGSLRVRHHADDIAGFIAKAGDRIRRTIRIPGIVEAALGIR